MDEYQKSKESIKAEDMEYIEAKGYVVGGQLGGGDNPEFLREGSCWEDFMHADRIVLGKSVTSGQKLY